MRVRILAWIVTVAIAFPVLYLAVDLSRLVELDILFLIFCTAIVGLFVDDIVATSSPTKTKR